MSDSWNQLQYQAYAQPVPLDPAEQVNPVWFPQWKQPDPEPVRPVEYRFQIPSVFFVGDEADFDVPVVVPDYGWYRPADEPVLPVEYRQQLESVFSLGLPIPPPTPAPDYGWYRPAEEPTLPVEFRYQLESFFKPANWEEIISTDSGVFFEAWVQPISQPVLPVEYRYLLPDMFAQVDEDDFVAGASPPTAHPVSVAVSLARANNSMNMPKSGNSAAAVKTKNSLNIS